MVETTPAELPPSEDEEFVEESLLAAVTSEEIVKRIGRLGLMSRHFFILGHEDWAADLDKCADLYKKVLLLRDDEGLLVAQEQKRQITPPVDGVKAIKGHV